ncbi:MAG TPA: hypothetical protein VL096_21130, partial [Pirellulaceae bacterium]|nr:hypothetical protein [Pirellulaceae bacterium]
FDIATGKSLHRLPVPERSHLLDISPDGSLLLTGDTLFGSDGFSRLDVWAPKLGKHAIGWQPLANTTDFFAVATWAAFIDKRQVLVQSSQNVTLWQLPECKPIYSVATDSRPVLSPNRKQFFDRKSGLIRDALTGEALVKLQDSQPSPPTALIDAIYAPDGNSIVGVLFNHTYSSIVRWNAINGEIMEQFGTPPVPCARLAWAGKRGLWLLSHPSVVLHGVTLIDLKQRQIVAQYRANGAHAVAPDGTLWLANAGRDASYIARGFSEADIEWPQLGATPSYAVIAPGSKVAIDFQSNLPEAAKLKPAFEAKVKAAGFTIDASATTKAVLVANQDRTIVQAGPPEVSIPAIVGRLAIVDGSGATAWEIKLRERNDNSVKFDTANWLNGWTIPSQLFKPDWQKQIATKEFPAAKP